MLAALAEFQALVAGGFRLDARIDHTLIIQILKSFIRAYEKIQGHRRNPGFYLDEALGGVFMLIIIDFAPLPQRLRSALSRVQEMPTQPQSYLPHLVLKQVAQGLNQSQRHLGWQSANIMVRLYLG